MKISRVSARLPEVQQAYIKHLTHLANRYGDEIPCTFCVASDRKIIEQLETMHVVVNDFAYAKFDGRSVTRHLMIVPKRHEALFGGFTQNEQAEYWSLMIKYHEAGFASMTRSAVDLYRSIPNHLHTHLFYYSDDQL